MQAEMNEDKRRAIRMAVHGDPDKPVTLTTDPSGGGQMKSSGTQSPQEENNMSEAREIDANKIIQSLQRRIGELVSQYETELAVRQAIIDSLNEELSAMYGDADG